MTRPFDPTLLQFYVTIPAPCPYLDGQQERKVFTQLDPLSGPQLNDYLTHSGFRRSQNVLYRPACETCSACKSLRVKVHDYKPGKSAKRTLSRNSDLTREICDPYATREQFDLLQTYLHTRHSGGGMTDMDFARYETMVEECASRTLIVEYRDKDNRLIACCLGDELSDGLSMVYSFFDPDQSRRTLGKFMILDFLQICKSVDMPWLYLGYWVKGSRKMEYKSSFRPAELLTDKGWIDFDDFDPSSSKKGFDLTQLQSL